MTFTQPSPLVPARATRRARARWLSVPALLLVATTATAAWADDVPISEAARQHFQAGVNLLQDPDGARYAEAYREFKTAYADSPSWKILSNLGITALKLERDGEAAEAFTNYLVGGGAAIDADERAQVERDLQTLRAGLVRVSISSDPPRSHDHRRARAERGWHGRQPLRSADVVARARIRGGHHRMTASANGYLDSVWEFDTPTQGDSHRFTLEKVAGAPPAIPSSGTLATPPPRYGTAPGARQRIRGRRGDGGLGRDRRGGGRARARQAQ